jgi:hypothetical protein
LRSLPAFVGAEPMLSRRRLVARAAGQLAGDRASFAQDAVTGTVRRPRRYVDRRGRPPLPRGQGLAPDMLDTIRDCMATYRPDDTFPSQGGISGRQKSRSPVFFVAPPCFPLRALRRPSTAQNTKPKRTVPETFRSLGFTGRALPAPNSSKMNRTPPTTAYRLFPRQRFLALSPDGMTAMT